MNLEGSPEYRALRRSMAQLRWMLVALYILILVIFVVMP